MASKAQKAAEQLRISQIGDFRSRMGGVMELPSGLVVKAKNPGGLTAFIANGTIPNSLLSIVQEQLSGGKNAKAAVDTAKNMAEDMESLGDMMRLMDVIVAATITSPKVRPVPTEEDMQRHNMLHPNEAVTTPEELRIEDPEDFLYVDEIDATDKQFIWQWVSGGTRDLAQFRRELEVNVDAVSAGKTPADASKPDSGADAG